MSEHWLDPPAASLSRAAFLDRFAGVYEATPWIAEQLFDRGLIPADDSLAALLAAFSSVVAAASPEQRLALLRAHPDLAGRAALAGQVTAESAGEQASAGLDHCSPTELARFQELNGAYKARFEFPFILAVKGRSRAEILAAFETRLEHSHETEFETALSQVNEIARLRLEAIAGAS
jgi:2-oxo-4-hydroxy-4-carboxy-5-ureidoimidazoline decarboxylase